MTRDDRGDDSAPYDTGDWVDVGRDGLWRPSGGERFRAMTILGLAIGALLVVAAIASVGGDDEEQEVAASTTTTEPQVVTTTSIVTTTAVDPASIDGEAPPGVCAGDTGREAAPLRQRTEATVLVLNGTSRNGHAGSVTDDLEALGYDAIVPANASALSVTTVEYLPGFCAEAVRLALELGIEGVEVRPLPEGNDVFLGRAEILVTLGSDSL